MGNLSGTRLVLITKKNQTAKVLCVQTTLEYNQNNGIEKCFFAYCLKWFHVFIAFYMQIYSEFYDIPKINYFIMPIPYFFCI